MRILFLVLLTISLVFTASQGQEKEEKIEVKVLKEPKVTTETPYYKITIDPEEIKKAGKSLRQFRNTTYLGYAVIFTGAIITYFGIENKIVDPETQEEKPNEPFLWTGGLVALIGQIIVMTAPHKIDEAGKHLQNSISYQKK